MATKITSESDTYTQMDKNISNECAICYNEIIDKKDAFTCPTCKKDCLHAYCVIEWAENTSQLNPLCPLCKANIIEPINKICNGTFIPLQNHAIFSPDNVLHTLSELLSSNSSLISFRLMPDTVDPSGYPDIRYPFRQTAEPPTAVGPMSNTMSAAHQQNILMGFISALSSSRNRNRNNNIERLQPRFNNTTAATTAATATSTTPSTHVNNSFVL